MAKMLPVQLTESIIKNTVPSMRYKDGEDFKAWQSAAYDKLYELLGMDKFEKCEPDLNIEYTKEGEKYTEIRFSFQSEKDYRVPCHLCIPNGAKTPVPLVICLQGHSKGMHISLGRIKYPGDEKSINGGDRDFVNGIAAQGYAALAIEQRNFGECGGDETGPQCHISSMANLLIGRTTIGERVWDIERAIDVIESDFKQIDAKKIMCMGNSGGGTATYYAACMEKRIIAAMPSCAVCSYDDSIVPIRHCTCNFIPHIREYFDMCDLAGLIFPRILVTVNGKDDDIFPKFSADKTTEFIKRLYAAQGAGENFTNVMGGAGHRFYAEDAWKAMNKIIRM